MLFQDGLHNFCSSFVTLKACPWPTFHWYQEYAKKDYPRQDFVYSSNSDNNNGTFTNPVIFGDFPDPDVIRVGDVYYMSTTTMQRLLQS